MLVMGVICAVLFITYVLGTITDKIDRRANELQLSLDGIKDRLNKLENK